jgi:hypothetical protein
VSEPEQPPPPPPEAPAAPEPTPAEEPILPNVYDDKALRDAIGKRKTPRPQTEPSIEDDDGEPAPKKRRRRTVLVSAAAILVGLAIATLIFLGRANSSRYLLVCTAEHVTAEVGRAFPPWGSHPINSPEWEPIPLPPKAACKPRETEEQAELAHWYYDMLIDRASTTLTSRDLLDAIPKPGAPASATTAVNPLDSVSEQLDQALLLARLFDGADQRKEVERLQGDVEYWRATMRLRQASLALQDAAKQFETAATHRPRHVDDAAAWGSFVRKLTDELAGGPAGQQAAPIAPAADAHVPAPPGTALPVEGPAAGSDVTPTPPAPPDAGLPTGGVLL